ncbi:MAG: hypothetical protein SGI92_07115 [Bryobacteraceae bacterium]|nr:hypothetical protein [Bryobacteraceae bacterium]
MRVAIVTCFLTAISLQADTLYLRDGKVVQGTFISGGSQSIRFLPDGGRAQTYPITRVDRLAFGDDAGTTSAASPQYDSSRNDSGRNDSGRNDRRYNDNRDDQSSVRSRTNNGGEIPSGTQVSVRMIDSINSNQTDVGKRYRASLDQDLVVDGRVVASRGSDATVEVIRVDQGRAISGREEISLSLTEITANGRRLTPVTQNAEITSSSRGSENVKVIGGTAVLGAIIGAIAGGGRGAAIGAGAGAATGAGVQAVRGQKIEVPSETQLLFNLSEPMRY